MKKYIILLLLATILSNVTIAQIDTSQFVYRRNSTDGKYSGVLNKAGGISAYFQYILNNNIDTSLYSLVKNQTDGKYDKVTNKIIIDGKPINTISANLIYLLNSNIATTDADNTWTGINYFSKIVADTLVAQTITNVTYNNLVSLISQNKLVPGSYYCITDYQTVHQITYTTDINTGNIEPLIVLAISTNQLSPEAFSKIYPQDIIYYDYLNNPDKITGSTKGYIYRRIDTKQNNDMPLDFRSVKYRRWQINVTTEDGTGESFDDIASVVKQANTNDIYIKIKAGIGHDFSDNNYWKLFEFQNLEYVSPFATNWFLAEDSDYPIYIPCSGLNINYNIFATSEYYNSAYSNSLKSPNGNIIDNSNFIVLGDGFNNNSIGAYFNDNSIGADFYSNSIGADFYSNSIGDGFNNNSIGGGFNNNSIGGGFNNNSIGAYFNNNSIGINFLNNDAKQNIGGITFSLSQFSGNYTKTIFKASDNNTYLQYHDGTSFQLIKLN